MNAHCRNWEQVSKKKKPTKGKKKDKQIVGSRPKGTTKKKKKGK